MPIAAGVFKRVSIKRQTALGAKAPAGAAGTARQMRRTSSTLNLTKATFGSGEILTSQQRRDMRHGVRGVSGSLTGELSAGAYQLPIESVLRRNATAGATTGNVDVITIASSGGGTRSGTLTRSTGNYLTDGFKVGDVVRVTGTGTANDNKNLLIVGLTATVMTVRTLNQTDIVAYAAVAAAMTPVSLAGRKTFIPETGHTRDYYTVEHFQSDIPDSEQFTDVVFTGMNIGLPATGMATIEFPAMGLDMQTGNAEYFTAPAAPATGPIMASVNGVLVVNGAVVADVTGLTMTVTGNHAVPGGVVGSQTDPDIFPGVIDATGSATVLFRDGTLRNLFLNESEFGIIAVLTGDNTAAAPVMSIVMPRCKFTGNTKDDGQTQITQTLPFTALENTAGGAGVNTERTTLSVQDSAFV